MDELQLLQCLSPAPNSKIDDILATRTFEFLLADDDPDARTLLDIALGGNNYNLSFYEDGAQAIEACKKRLPDLAILDVQMPGASGIEVCQSIKEMTSRSFVPVVLLTSLGETGDKVAGLDHGADEYITKPFSLPELEARVRALLRIKVLTDELRRTREILEQKEKELIAAQVAGAAAHELGQPLTTVILGLQILQQLKPEEERFYQQLRTVTQQCQRMTEILKSLNGVREYKTTPYPGDLEILDLGVSNK